MLSTQAPPFLPEDIPTELVFGIPFREKSLREREITLPDILSKNGYKTAIFGKWHLGHNYPYRAQDRGFGYHVIHSAGGVGQAPDYWGNDYFDDTYLKNGTYQKFKGFCTDIWFDEAIKIY